MEIANYSRLQLRSDNVDKNDLPRILLLGDCITELVYEQIRIHFKGVYYVDYISSSFPVDLDLEKFFTFINERHYLLVRFNFGLNGLDLDTFSYERSVNNFIDNVHTTKILGLTTIIKKKGNQEIDPLCQHAIEERNAIINKIGKERNVLVDDVYSLSLEIINDYRSGDGVSYLGKGITYLASSYICLIEKALQNN